MFKLVFFHFAFENKIHTKALIYEYTFVESIIKRSLKIELTSSANLRGGILALLRLSLTCFRWWGILYFVLFRFLLFIKRKVAVLMPERAQKRGENWGNEGKTGRDRIPPPFSAMMMWRESVRRVLVEELTLWENVTVFCNKHQWVQSYPATPVEEVRFAPRT